MIAAIKEEHDKNSADKTKWIELVKMNHDLLAGTLSADGVAKYHEQALTINREKHSKTKQMIGACMIILAIALVAAAVVAVPFLSLAIVGSVALSSTMATALATAPFGLGAAVSGVRGGLFFRKTAVTRHMLALEQETKKEATMTR